MTPRSVLISLSFAALIAASSATAQQPVSQPAGSVAAGAYVAGSFADGSSITFGLKADAATCAITNTAMACLRQLHADLIAPLPAGNNAIGSITNTAFGISGTLPAFAATPTFNIGTAPSLTITNTGFNALQGGAANSLTNPFYTAPATGSVQSVSISQATPGTTNGVQTLSGSTTTVTQATATNLETQVNGSNGGPIATDTSNNIRTVGAPFASTVAGVTLGSIGVFSSVLATSNSRHSCLIQNTSTDTEYVFFGAVGSATTATSFQLPPGGTIQCAGADGTVATDVIAMAGKAAASDTVVVQSK